MTTARPVEQIALMGHDESYALAEELNGRLLTTLRSLEPAQWEAATDCPAWSVRQITIHLVANGEGFLSLKEGMRQQRRSKRYKRDRGLEMIDAYMQAAVDDRNEWSAAEALGRLERVLPAFARRRHRTPALLRRLVKIPFEPESLRLSYLFDTIINRDVFMHRIDIARATATPLHLTADVEGRLVADVMREWAETHGKPFDVELTGPAGGRFRNGSGGESISMDAIEFCRVLSGRGTGAGLLSTEVPF